MEGAELGGPNDCIDKIVGQGGTVGGEGGERRSRRQGRLRAGVHVSVHVSACACCEMNGGREQDGGSTLRRRLQVQVGVSGVNEAWEDCWRTA